MHYVVMYERSSQQKTYSMKYKIVSNRNKWEGTNLALIIHVLICSVTLELCECGRWDTALWKKCDRYAMKN
jgi:hypothetical protein